MSDAVLMATTSTNQQWSDPSEDLLFVLFEDVAGGAEEYFIVDRLSDPSGQTYCQVVRCYKTDASVPCNCYRSHDSPWWVVERREGSANEHYAAATADMRTAHEVVAAWSFQHSPDLDGVDWTRLSFG